MIRKKPSSPVRLADAIIYAEQEIQAAVNGRPFCIYYAGPGERPFSGSFGGPKKDGGADEQRDGKALIDSRL